MCEYMEPKKLSSTIKRTILLLNPFKTQKPRYPRARDGYTKVVSLTMGVNQTALRGSKDQDRKMTQKVLFLKETNMGFWFITKSQPALYLHTIRSGL